MKICKIIMTLLILFNMSCSSVEVMKGKTANLEHREHKYFFPEKLEEGYDIEKLNPKDYIVDNKVYKYEDAVLMMCFYTMSTRSRIHYEYKKDGSVDEKGKPEKEMIYTPKAKYKLCFVYKPVEESKEQVATNVALPNRPSSERANLTHNEALKLLEEFTRNTLLPYISEYSDNMEFEIITQDDFKEIYNTPEELKQGKDIISINLGEVNSGTAQAVATAGCNFSPEINIDANGYIILDYKAFTQFIRRKSDLRDYLITFSHEFVHVLGIDCHTEDILNLVPSDSYSQEVMKYMYNNFQISNENSKIFDLSNLMTPEEIIIGDFINSSTYYSQNHGIRNNYINKYINMNRYRVGTLMLREAIEKRDMVMFKRRIELLKNDKYFIEYLLHIVYLMEESVEGINRFRLQDRDVQVRNLYDRKLERINIRGLRQEYEDIISDIKWRELIVEKKRDIIGRDKNKNYIFGKELTQEEILFYQESIMRRKIRLAKLKKIIDESEELEIIYPEVMETVKTYVPEEILSIEATKDTYFSVNYKETKEYFERRQYEEKYAESTGIEEDTFTAYYNRMMKHLLETNKYVIEVQLNALKQFLIQNNWLNEKRRNIERVLHYDYDRIHSEVLKKYEGIDWYPKDEAGKKEKDKIYEEIKKERANKLKNLIKTYEERLKKL